MELIDDCHISLYDKCKYKVKVWEHNFKKNNGRLPSKLDIKEAESEVRKAYKTYFQLKTSALEQSFRDVDGFNSEEEVVHSETNPQNYKNPVDPELNGHIINSTWGFHLNKTFATVENICELPKPSPNLNLKITQKLFEGSKLIKRNPRKSLSQSKNEFSLGSSSLTTKNSNSSVLSSSQLIEQSNSVADPSSTNTDMVSSQCFNLKNTEDVQVVDFTLHSQNIIQNVLDKNKPKLNLQNIDLDWLARVENNTTMELENEQMKTDFGSDEDIIDNSDDESSNSAIAKRVKHNGVSISCSKIVDNQKCSYMSVISKVDTSLDVQVHDVISKKIIEKKCPKSGIINTQDNCEIDKLEWNKEAKFSFPHLANSSKKLRGKTLNENYVRINLKKKIYARGKKKNFAKYKKKIWKTKQKFSPEAEEDIVTKKKIISDELLPLDAHLNESGEMLVTLNQASGKEVSNNISPKKYKGEEETDEDVSLSQIKKMIVGRKKRTRVESIDNEYMESKTKKKKHSASFKKEKQKPKTFSKIPKVIEVENIVVNSIAPKSRKQKVNNSVISNLTNVQYLETEIEKMNQNQEKSMFDDLDDSDLLFEAQKLEETFIDRKVSPLYTTKGNGSLIDTPQEVFEALGLFGYETFREGQERAIMRILSGKSTLVTLSTGSGKSLCYQLPAYLFGQRYKCITLVISPLISLMEDQIECIPGILNAACLHGNQSKTQYEKVLKAVVSGELNILMVSPETIMSYDSSSGFGSIIDKLPPIAFACLDEAHCLSQWSHNFRPSYLVVCKILQDNLGVKVILGLTATATKTTRNILTNLLKIADGEHGIIKDTPIPSNLSLSVSKDPNKDEALLGLLSSKPFIGFRSIIVYCLRRDECEKVASFLRTTLKDHFPCTNSSKTKNMSLQAEAYHAGLSAYRRKAIQKAFISGKLRIIVATIAFGMGINKCDIRSVIHYNMPAKFESYVQEIGRAGRDDRQAQCHVFLDKENSDIFQHSRHIYSNSVDRHIIRKLLRKVFPSCCCEETCTKHEVMFSIDFTVQELDVTKEVLSTLLCYLELHENEYIKILKPSYAKCKILSYSGPDLINKIALSCEPLKIALKFLENCDKPSNVIEFPVTPVARVMNYDSGMCKGILKNLEWTNVSGQSKRSNLTVEFFDLSFHLLSTGNLTDKALDEVLDSLYNKVLQQENTSYTQLIHFNRTLAKYSSTIFEKSIIDKDEKSECLKQDIREYFESDEPLKWVCIPEISEKDKCAIQSDIQSFVSKYHDTNFTGRSIAKIFHGIPSPNIPAYVWGRTVFWRKYLHIHFNIICKIAAMELIKMQL